MERIRAIIDGSVQGVGFRYTIRYIASKYKVKGYVKNLDDGRVEIVAEGNTNVLKEFLKEINIKREPIEVESIDVSYEQPTGEFSTFKIITGKIEEEMVEGFATGALYLNILLNKQDKMLEKQDLMLDKQDKMLEKQDMVLGKLDDLKVSVVQEIHALRDDIKELFDRRLSKIEEDIVKIKNRLGMT